GTVRELAKLLRIVQRMASCEPISVRKSGQARSGVCLRGLEQPEMGFVTFTADGDERFVDQIADGLAHLEGIDRIVGRHRHGGLDRKRPGKNRKPLQDLAVSLREKVVAPVDQRLDRLMTWTVVTAPLPKQRELTGEQIGNALDAVAAHPTGDQSDR